MRDLSQHRLETVLVQNKYGWEIAPKTSVAGSLRLYCRSFSTRLIKKTLGCSEAAEDNFGNLNSFIKSLLRSDKLAFSNNLYNRVKKCFVIGNKGTL
ncbi:hypothetical protein TNCV_2462891 [Trichonephila clavipes]|nr:hypothetical protein TNCV_2462891 [Trichonephila clavipes]